MKTAKPDKSFAQKYGLLHKGDPVRISEKTRDTISSLSRRAEEINEKGREYSKQEKRLFGGCPQPGEPGSEKFFNEL